MKAIAAAITFAAGVFMAEQTAAQNARYTVLGFNDLIGWQQDDHQSALTVFLETCGDIKDPDWSSLCAFAREQEDAKAMFELLFRPVLIEDGNPALFTGYFEPELNGAREQTEQFRFPLYALPDEVKPDRSWLTRQQIEETKALEGRGLEIAWVDDPVEKFFLQIQGSGRVRLPDGDYLRVGYAGANGQPYRSVGQELVRRGVYTVDQVSAQVIRNWVKGNAEEGQKLLWHNPSYVFFREVSHVPPDKGPLGAMNRSITEGRTIAVDPKFVPLGAPVWVEKGGRGAFRKLMIAQDTGSAIKGAQRADIFYGTGDLAGRNAGRVKDPGRMVVLMPIRKAFEAVSEDLR